MAAARQRKEEYNSQAPEGSRARHIESPGFIHLKKGD